jgi:alkylhydroperoxidase/carboxymuconolactone decarboxylase family protein YurZ
VNADQQELLRRLALNDEAAAAASLQTVLAAAGDSSLDARTFALARVAALIAVESPRASVRWAVDSALAAGADDEEIVDVLRAVAPIIGLARVTSAAPGLALALGYDLDEPDTA